MKLLEEIPAFPSDIRRALEAQYGIDTAEAFFAHAVQDAEGMQRALHLNRAAVERLTTLVEGFLPRGYAERCRTPTIRHPRGAILQR